MPLEGEITGFEGIQDNTPDADFSCAVLTPLYSMNLRQNGFFFTDVRSLFLYDKGFLRTQSNWMMASLLPRRFSFQNCRRFARAGHHDLDSSHLILHNESK